MSLVQKVSFKADNGLKWTINEPINGTTPQQKISPENNTKTLKAAVYVSAAMALASLGVTAVVATKNMNLTKQLEKTVKNLETEISNNPLKKTIDNLGEKIDKGLMETNAKLEGLASKQELENFQQETSKKINDLGKWEDGQINGLREEMTANLEHVEADLSEKIPTEALNSVMSVVDFPNTKVHVNGMDLQLANVLNGYGKNTGTIENLLRTESTKRILGITEKISPKSDITVRIPTSEFKGFSSTGGMAIVPKEVIANLGAIINGKQNTRLIVDTPLYLGQVEDNVYYSIAKRADGAFDYIASNSNKPMAKLEQLDTMRLPIYTDKAKTGELVDVFIARNQEQLVDWELLKPWLDENTSNELQNAIEKGDSFNFNRGVLHVTCEKNAKPVAKIKYDAVFYKHDKFRMDGPVVDGQTKNIYNNLTHESGETERFMYFDKFFYEYLLRGKETSNENLKADLIIGNDWQTGGISAMMKLLTTVRKHFGLAPKVADEMYQTPIMTIMHNAGLAGNVWHSQEKLLNVMFGEHAAMITKNAWMPSHAGLNPSSLNGLFNGNNLNPQTMAAAYSDIITPVSVGYGREIAGHSGFGGANHDIFRMRARVHEFADVEHLKYIARQNGLNSELVPKNNMAYHPITNGCDRVNNALNNKSITDMENAFGLEKGSLRFKLPNESVYDWHQHNKEIYINKVIEDIDMARNGKGNPMNIELPEMTNLQGVTKDTMVVSTAGRIVDQKGLDIFAEAIEEFLSRHQGEDLPVFYAQGTGDMIHIENLLNVKRRVAQKYGQDAANRIVFAKLFKEKGRYDGCKLMSDFTVMSSWFEPCGLVHKEIAAFSGSIPIVNEVGGLTDGLTNGVNAIFAEFRPKFENYQDALQFNRKHFADALDKAFDLFKNKEQFQNVLTNSFETDHSWLKFGGPMEEYAKVFVDYGVLKPEVLQHS